MSSNLQIQKTCTSFCGKVFTALTLHNRYCSHSCNQQQYKQRKREEKLKPHRSPGHSTPLKTEINYNTLQQKLFLSLDEAAARLGASRRTLQRLIAKGTLKAGKVGNEVLFNEGKLTNSLNSPFMTIKLRQRLKGNRISLYLDKYVAGKREYEYLNFDDSSNSALYKLMKDASVNCLVTRIAKKLHKSIEQANHDIFTMFNRMRSS